MKLFKRIKAEHYVEPSDKVTVGEISFPPSQDTHTWVGKKIGAIKDGPSLVEGFPVYENSLLAAASEQLKKKVDADITKPAFTVGFAPGSFVLEPEQAEKALHKLKTQPSVLESMLAFPTPAKNGQIHGVWNAVVEKIEKDNYSTKYSVALRINTGPDKGKVLVLKESDELTINYTVTLG